MQNSKGSEAHQLTKLSLKYFVPRISFHVVGRLEEMNQTMNPFTLCKKMSLRNNFKIISTGYRNWRIQGEASLAPPRSNFFHFSFSFQQKSCQIIGFHPKRRGWRPHLRLEILDPPLIEEKFSLSSRFVSLLLSVISFDSIS